MEEDNEYPILAYDDQGSMYEALQRACEFIAGTGGECPYEVTGREYAVCEDCTNEPDVCWQMYFLGVLKEVE